MRGTKPLKLSIMLSIAYSDFRADFAELRASETFLYIADLGRRPAKPNKASVAKAFFINNMTKNGETNPTKLSFVLSVAYSDPNTSFLEVWMEGMCRR